MFGICTQYSVIEYDTSLTLARIIIVDVETSELRTMALFEITRFGKSRIHSSLYQILATNALSPHTLTTISKAY